MNTTYLLLGSNMGNSRQQLLQAKKNIQQQIGKIIRQSNLYSTAAWGNTHQPDFLNQVIIVQTKLTAAQTMQAILTIEKKMGRIRTVKNAARIIDIDILFFNNEIIKKKNLTIPHPEIQNRRFVLIPLAEIAVSLVHPLLKKTAKELLNICTDTLNVQKI